MNVLETMRQALDALEYNGLLRVNQAKTALRAAIEHLKKQEPVAWILSHPDGNYLCWGKPENYDGLPLYTHPAPAVPEKLEPVIDPNCTCDEHGACAYCWNGKKHDGYSDGMTPRDDQEFLSKTDGLDGPVEGLQANQDCGIRYVE